jgi:hypothetical protein
MLPAYVRLAPLDEMIPDAPLEHRGRTVPYHMHRYGIMALTSCVGAAARTVGIIQHNLFFGAYLA